MAVGKRQLLLSSGTGMVISIQLAHVEKTASYNFPGYKMTLVRFLNLAVVLSVGSLAATHLQQSQALRRTTLSTVLALLGALLQVSPAPFWWSLEIQTREDFFHISVWYQDYSMVNTILDAWWYRKWRVGVSVPHQQASGTIHGFHSSFLFSGEPTKFHGSQYLLETFEVLRGYVLKRHSYCSAATTYWFLLPCLGLAFHATSFAWLLYS